MRVSGNRDCITDTFLIKVCTFAAQKRAYYAHIPTIRQIYIYNI